MKAHILVNLSSPEFSTTYGYFVGAKSSFESREDRTGVRIFLQSEKDMICCSPGGFG